jgi:hypothetical protein
MAQGGNIMVEIHRTDALEQINDVLGELNVFFADKHNRYGQHIELLKPEAKQFINLFLPFLEVFRTGNGTSFEDELKNLNNEGLQEFYLICQEVGKICDLESRKKMPDRNVTVLDDEAVNPRKLLTNAQWNIVKQDLDVTIANLSKTIQDLNNFSNGIAHLPVNIRNAANIYLAVDFSLPLDASELSYALGNIRDGLVSMTREDFRYNDYNHHPDKSNNLGFAYFFGSKIYLGPKYFDPQTTDNTRQGTLLHEKTHHWLQTGRIVYDVQPNPYGDYYAQQRPANLKAKNADNWTFFYQQIYSGGH